MRLIDANTLREAVKQKGAASELIWCVAEIDRAPTIDAEPVRHGRWVDRYGNKYDNHLYECSECKGKALYRFEVDELGKEIAVQDLSDYCPHCGAKMDGGVSND